MSTEIASQLLEFLAQNDNDMLDEEAASTLWVEVGASDAEDDARPAKGVVGTLAVTLEDENRTVISRYRLVLVELEPDTL
jgi:hypothetical protein